MSERVIEVIDGRQKLRLSMKPRKLYGAAKAERDAGILALRREGLYPFQIAQQLGVSRALVHKVCQEAGLGVSRETMASADYIAAVTAASMAGTRAKRGDSRTAQVAQMVKANWSDALIAMKLKTNRSNVQALKYRARRKGLLERKQ